MGRQDTTGRSTGAAPHRVLIVEDEPDTVIFLTAWLEDEGYEAWSATDGNEGLALLRKHRPDVVLMDLKMPGHTGLRLYRAMHHDEELRSTPVIFVTGLAEFDLFAADCRPLPPPVAHITKPISLPALAEAIRKALGLTEAPPRRW